MPRPEDESNSDAQASQREPFELPPLLAEFLAGQEYAMVTELTDQGTAFILKAPAADIGGAEGNIPIALRHELYQHPRAPVIRTVVTVFDRPTAPLKFETFINVADEQQLAEYAVLAGQDELLLLFYDEGLTHRLTKRVKNDAGEQMRCILIWANRVRASIPGNQYDFDSAKAVVMRNTRL